MDTAKAQVLFKYVEGCSTPGSVLNAVVKARMKGFEGVDEESVYMRGVSGVGVKDLERVFGYLKELKSGMCVVVTGDEKVVEKCVEMGGVKKSVDEYML